MKVTLFVVLSLLFCGKHREWKVKIAVEIWSKIIFRVGRYGKYNIKDV